VRPTRTGLAVLVAGPALVLGGALAGWLVLVAIGVAGLLAVAAGLLAVARRPPLTVSRGVYPARVARGDLAVARLQAMNMGTRSAAAARAVETVAGEETSVVLPRLPPGGTRTVSYRLPTHRRGALAVGPLRVRREDALGVAVAERDEGGLTTLWVHPRTHAVRLPATGRTAHLDGPTTDSAPRGSITFHTLRDYVLGDDLRHVHWRSSARLGTLVVRQHVDTSQPRTGIVLDTRAAAYVSQAAFEEAVEVAASLLCSGVERGWPVRVVSTGGLDLAASGGAGAVRELAAMLDRLAEVTPRQDARGATPERTARTLPGGTCLAVVSGATSGAELGALTSLRRRHERVVLLQVGGAGAGAGGAGGDSGVGDLPVQGVQILAGPDAGTVCAAWNRAVAR